MSALHMCGQILILPSLHSFLTVLSHCATTYLVRW